MSQQDTTPTTPNPMDIFVEGLKEETRDFIRRMVTRVPGRRGWDMKTSRFEISILSFVPNQRGGMDCFMQEGNQTFTGHPWSIAFHPRPGVDYVGIVLYPEARGKHFHFMPLGLLPDVGIDDVNESLQRATGDPSLTVDAVSNREWDPSFGRHPMELSFRWKDDKGEFQTWMRGKPVVLDDGIERAPQESSRTLTVTVREFIGRIVASLYVAPGRTVLRREIPRSPPSTNQESNSDDPMNVLATQHVIGDDPEAVAAELAHLEALAEAEVAAQADKSTEAKPVIEPVAVPTAAGGAASVAADASAPPPRRRAARRGPTNGLTS